MGAQTGTRASVRQLLTQILQTDAALVAFCMDHFPAVHNEFSVGMGRTEKLNMLLSNIETEEILARLCESHGAHPLLREHCPDQVPQPRSESIHEPAVLHDRIYPIWVEVAEGTLRAALNSFGYSYERVFDRCAMFTTHPFHGRSLSIRVINLAGHTRIHVQVIPPMPDSAMLIDTFFRTFEVLNVVPD